MKDSKKRFRAIQEICRTIKKCRTRDDKKHKRGEDNKEDDDGLHDGCGAIQPLRTYIQDKLNVQVEFEVEEETGADKKRRMTAEDVRKIFVAISNEDCKIMGFDPGNGHI